MNKAFLIVTCISFIFLSGCSSIIPSRSFTYTYLDGSSFSCSRGETHLSVDPKVADTVLELAKLSKVPQPTLMAPVAPTNVSGVSTNVSVASTNVSVASINVSGTPTNVSGTPTNIRLTKDEIKAILKESIKEEVGKAIVTNKIKDHKAMKNCEDFVRVFGKGIQ